MKEVVQHANKDERAMIIDFMGSPTGQGIYMDYISRGLSKKVSHKICRP